MTKLRIPDEKADMPADGGDKPLDSHVQAAPPVYGEPKGPRPATMFRHKFGVHPPPDRERDGFIGGRDEVGLGDLVGSGPEEWERKPKPQEENEDQDPPDKGSD